MNDPWINPFIRLIVVVNSNLVWTSNFGKMENIYIRQASIEDAPAIAQIQYEALEKFHNFYNGFLATHPRDILPITTKTALNNPKNIFLVAVDAATDEVVGFVRYAIVPEKQPEGKKQEEEKEKEDAKSQLDRSQPEFANLFAPKEHVKELWEEFSARDDEMDACYEGVAKGQKHYCTLLTPNFSTISK